MYVCCTRPNVAYIQVNAHTVCIVSRSPDPLLASIFIIMTSCGRREGVWSTARTDFVSGVKVLNHRNANYCPPHDVIIIKMEARSGSGLRETNVCM